MNNEHKTRTAGALSKVLDRVPDALPLYVALPTGEWVPLKVTALRALDGQAVLVLVPDLAVQS